MKSLVFLVTLMIFTGLAQAGNDPKAPSPAPAKAAVGANDKHEGEKVAPTTNEPDDKKKSEVAAAIDLKVKSTFEMEGDNRNPFWPIGWKPADAEASKSTMEHNAGDIPPSAFLVSSITMDPRTRFAIINGKTMMEGQQFGLQVGNQTYQLTVKAIEDGRVILSRRNQEIVVSLRRK